MAEKEPPKRRGRPPGSRNKQREASSPQSETPSIASQPASEAAAESARQRTELDAAIAYTESLFNVEPYNPIAVIEGLLKTQEATSLVPDLDPMIACGKLSIVYSKAANHAYKNSDQGAYERFIIKADQYMKTMDTLMSQRPDTRTPADRAMTSGKGL